MPRLGRGGGFQIDTGIDLGPWFTQSIVEAIIPKAIRKQSQEQAALSKLADLAPEIAKLSEEDKKAFGNWFFRAHGIYQPPWIRGLFGAGKEPILPLPEGAREEHKFVPGFLGLGGRVQKQYILPPLKPIEFAGAPLLSSAAEAEIRRGAKAQGLGDEEIEDIVQDARMKKVSPWSTSVKFFEQRTVGRGEKWIQNYMRQTGATKEAAVDALMKERPDVGALYKEHISRLETDIEYRKALTEAKGREVGVKEEAERRKERERIQRQQQFETRMQFEKQRELRVGANQKAALEQKNEAGVLDAAQKAFTIYSRNINEHNRLEMLKEKQSIFSETPYLRMELPRPDWESWLLDEGAVFGERLRQLRGGGAAPGVTPPPGASRIEKNQTFDEKHGLVPGKKRR